GGRGLAGQARRGRGIHSEIGHELWVKTPAFGPPPGAEPRLPRPRPRLLPHLLATAGAIVELGVLVNTRFTAAKFAFSWVPSQNGFVLKWQHQDFMEVGGQTPFCWRPGGAIRKLVRYRAYTRSTLLTSRETIHR